MSARAEQLEAISAGLGDLATPAVSLASRCTYKVGGAAALFVEAQSVADLESVAAALAGTDVPTLIIGKGSNLLVADAGFDGVVVQLGEAFTEIEIDENEGTSPARRGPPFCRSQPAGPPQPPSPASSGPSACRVPWAVRSG